MSRLLGWSLLGVLLAGGIGYWYFSPLRNGSPMDTYGAEAFWAEYRPDPGRLSQLGLPISEESGNYLFRLSPPWTQRGAIIVSQQQAIYARLQAYQPGDSLLIAQKTQLLHYLNQALAQAEQYPYFDRLFPQQGMHLAGLQSLVEYHTIRNQKDINAYLRRLDLLPSQLQAWWQSLSTQLKAKPLIRPESLSRVKAEVAYLRDTPPLQHPLYRSFARKLATMDPTLMNEIRAVEHLAKVSKLLQEKILPAYTALAQSLDTLQIDPTASRSGDASFYQTRLEHTLGGTWDVAALAQWAQTRVQTRLNSMTAYLDSLGVAPQAFGERLGAWMEKTHAFDDTKAGHEACLKLYRELIAQSKSYTAGLFAHALPVQRLQVEAMPDYLTQHGPPLMYLPASLDGQRRARLYVNLSYMDWHRPRRMAVLVYLFVYPGTHLRAEWLRQAYPSWWQKSLNFPTNTAGWPGYALGLMQDVLHVLDHDPELKMAYHQACMLTEAKLVAEIGLFAQGWSETKALAYLRAQTGLPPDWLAHTVQGLLSRPGSAAAAVLGQFSFEESRQQYQSKMEHFSWPNFHQLMLSPQALSKTLLTEFRKQGNLAS